MKQAKILFLLKQRLITFLISLIMAIFSSFSWSDDLEIYQGAVDDGSVLNSPLVNPNILFVMDTSGSMGWGTPSRYTLGSYDHTIDYGGDGNAADDDYIYVYDTSLDYTGHYITQTQNKCDAMVQYHADSNNFDYPLFINRAIQWQTGTMEVTDPNCTGGGTTPDGGDNVTHNNGNWTPKLHRLVSGAASVAFQVSLDSGYKPLGFRVTFHQDSGNPANPIGNQTGGTCEKSLNKRSRTKTCNLSVPSNANYVQLSVRNNGGKKNQTRRFDWDLDIVAPATCSPITQNVPNNDWNENIETNASNAWVLECQADAGVHGLTAASSNKYPRFCHINDCTSPNYTTSTSQDISYTSEGVPQRYFVPGNFHDYIQLYGIPADPSTLPQHDASVHCSGNTSSNVGDVFVDTVTNTVMTCARRLDVMKTALNNLLETMANSNVGLMRFNSDGSGGTILQAVKDINDSVVKTDMISAVNGLPASGNTPLSESIYEAYRYYAGLSLNYGQANTDGDAKENGDYKTPMLNHCQPNNIVLLTDGEPTSDVGANDAIAGLHGSACGSGHGECLEELTGYMANNDVNSDIQLDNNVYTYTIGLADDFEYLADAAEAGAPPNAQDSGYYVANDALALEGIFRQIIANIQTVSSDTFVAPAVSVNAFNRLQHRKDLYFAIFKPDVTPRWNGNIKKYRVQSDATIVDVNAVDAIDTTTGFFKTTARSFWSNLVDGAVVEKGGFAGELTNSRNLFGNLDATINVVSLTNENTGLDAVTNFTGQVLAAGVDVGETGSDVQEEAASRELIARWTIGEDVQQDLGGSATDSNLFAADTLHGTPYVLSYGTSDANPEDLVFITTNQGVLHAINGDDGSEKWAYIPDESLYKNLGAYFYKDVADDHVYGLDGEISFSIERDAAFEITKAHLFLGQRRGGKQYYAIDVTEGDDASDPVEKLWTIDGGTGDFAHMGQTWAKPLAAKINYCESGVCGLKEVVILSGGYDEDYDDDTNALSDLKGNVDGNAIYIVDAGAAANGGGTVLWKAYGGTQEASNDRDFHSSDMGHSFPSEPTAIDINQDGAIDIMFAVDIAGRIWRFDFKAAEGADDDNDISDSDNTNSVAGGIIADLSETGVNRRFYNTVDVALTPPTEGGDNTRFNLITGSGYRAHPVAEETHGNRMYFVFDENISEPLYGTDDKANYEYVVSGGSSGVIDNLAVVSSGQVLNTETTHKYGFYIALENASYEKMLNRTLISDFRVLAVSYTPEDLSNNIADGVCTAGTGSSKVYEINLLTGEVEITALARSGISARPVVVYILEIDADGYETLKPVVIIGTEPFKGEDFDLGDRELGQAVKTRWWETDREN